MMLPKTDAHLGTLVVIKPRECARRGATSHPITGAHRDAIVAAQRLLVRFDHVASFIVSANRSAM